MAEWFIASICGIDRLVQGLVGSNPIPSAQKWITLIFKTSRVILVKPWTGLGVGIHLVNYEVREFNYYISTTCVLIEPLTKNSPFGEFFVC